MYLEEQAVLRSAKINAHVNVRFDCSLVVHANIDVIFLANKPILSLPGSIVLSPKGCLRVILLWTFGPIISGL